MTSSTKLIVFYSFYGVDPATLTHLFYTFCLSLHGAATWSLSNSTLRSLEVAFNNILQKIWHLPFNSSYCEITQHIQLDFSKVTVSLNFKYPSTLVLNVYSVSANFCYTATGYNSLCGASQLNQYSPDDAYYANSIRELRVCGSTSLSIELLIRTISSS